MICEDKNNAAYVDRATVVRCGGFILTGDRKQRRHHRNGGSSFAANVAVKLDKTRVEVAKGKPCKALGIVYGHVKTFASSLVLEKCNFSVCAIE